jgi:hypothetical protein
MLSVVKQARYWAGESLQFCKKKGNNQQANGTGQRQIEWSSPEEDKLKINTAGAFDGEIGTGGWGFVIRDHSGAVQGAGAGHLCQLSSAAMAEAHTYQEALHAAASWGMINVQIEADAQNLLNGI